MIESKHATPSRDVFAGRLHPLTLLFDVLGVIRSYLLPALLLLLITRDFTMALILLVLMTPSVIASLAKYLTFTYEIEGAELKISRGLLHRRHRNIPLERVHDLRIEQTWLQRFFKVVVAYVETAGGEGPEATLSVLSAERAEGLRTAIFAHTPTHAPTNAATQSAEPILLHHVSIFHLLLSSLSYKRMTFSLALSLGFFGLFGIDKILGFASGQDIMNWSGFLLSHTRKVIGESAILLAMMLFAFFVFLFITLAVSMVWSATIFHNFTLSRLGNDLHRAYGLLTRRSSSLPWHRIQILEIEEDLIMRSMGLATVRADTAGSMASAARVSGRDVLLPVISRPKIPEMLPEMLPDVGTETIAWQQVSTFAIRRGTLKGAIFIGLGTIIALSMIPFPFGLAPVLLLPFVYGYNLVQYQYLAYAYGSNYFHTRRGWLRHSTYLIPIRNIQAVTVHQGLFDRRLRLATLKLHTAGQAYTGGGAFIPNIPEQEAYALAARLVHHTAATRYRW